MTDECEHAPAHPHATGAAALGGALVLFVAAGVFALLVSGLLALVGAVSR